MPERLISELLDLPDQVRQGDFVLNLSAGVTNPERTLRDYVVTPQLVACFHESLNFMKSAVESASSKACYLHGSFGAGKSHFMAVLHLLLQHNAAVRSIPELAEVCAKHEWVESKKFLLVPYHMIGARNMESAILGGYVDHVKQLHPDAPLPGVYLADEIFKDAVQLREKLGDEKFFEELNKASKGGGKSGWGKLTSGWDAARFEAALVAPPKSDERSRLVGDLVETIFKAYRGIAQGKDEAYVDLDQGLAVISSHAKSLGYDALILFLDELILWLATHSANLDFVQTEGNKLAKLVESRKAERPAPIVSFVARQRDLRELIGENVAGAGQLNFSDVLSHWEGRFHTIKLEDRNLPLIAQKRVLKVKNDACRAELDESFERTAQVRNEIMETLLTREADRAMFKQVYPFTPALIQALIAVSGALQRERTALKIMLMLLVERRETLRLGDVIPLGDLWDVVAKGDEPFTDVMRVNFDNARRLYSRQLVPMLEEQHQIDLEVDRERAKMDAEVAQKLGRFENDARLLKSLLLSALVHGVESLNQMKCSKLAALNHGTVRSRVPNREHQVVADKMRTWAGMAGQIKISDDAIDPVVSIQLSDLDVEPIIEAARAFDNAGNRQSRIRRMLFESLGVEDPDELFVEYPFVWRGSSRSADILFTNVRELPDESFRSSEGWKLVIDFPFDAAGHTPVEDIDQVNRFRDKGQPQSTIVWLPSFFSTRTQTELGKLVILDRLLLSTNLDQYAKHLSLQDRERARGILQNQQTALSQRLRMAVEAAYGIRSESMPGILDTSYDISESHYLSLDPTLVPQRPVGATLGEAAEHLLDQALSHQYPKHPKFEQEVKPGKDLRQVLDVCLQAARTADGRVFVEDHKLRQRLRNVVNPLDLGKMSETHFVLESTWKNLFHKCLMGSGQPSPTVADLRRWMDQPEARGLPTAIQNLLILVYAEQTNRSFRLHGSVNYPASLDDMPDALELREEALPDSTLWTTAVERVGAIFGEEVSKDLRASNLALLASKVKAAIEAYQTAVDSLPGRVQLALKNLGVEESAANKSDRVRTAKAVRSLLSACQDAAPILVVEAIAKAKIDSSPTAMGKSLKSSKTVLDGLSSTKWELFSAVAQMDAANPRRVDVDQLLKDVRGWLMAEELAVAEGLVAKLSEAEGKAIKLLTPPPQPTPPPPPPTKPGQKGWKVLGKGRTDRLTSKELGGTIEHLSQKLEENERRRISIEWTLEEESE